MKEKSSISQMCSYFTEKIQTAALYCQVNDTKPTTLIKDINVIKRIITMLGYKYRFVPHPEEKIIEIVSEINENRCDQKKSEENNNLFIE